MRRSLWAIFFVLVFASVSAFAKTPDGQPPSRETVCDNEKGAAYGLCVSYCEAKDCGDPNQRASNQGCESVRKNFEKKTGRTLPCLIQCPCFGTLQLFADIQSGVVRVTSCFIGDFETIVTTEDGETAVISALNATCSASNEPQFVDLDADELLLCRVRLRDIVEAQGVPCTFPE